MEGKNIYSRLDTGCLSPSSHTAQLSDYSADGLGKCRFQKAFVTQERAAGMCRLFLIWQRGRRRRSLQVHQYLLCFNHEGIKDYQVEDISYLGLRGWENRLGYPMVSLGLAEAASLIKDAYEQNKRYRTKAPSGIGSSHLLLDFDTEGVEPSRISYGLFPPKVNVEMFTNIYLSALKRLDWGLLYDLAHGERQSKLGTRLDYLRNHEDELSQCTFLRTGITAVEVQGRISWVKAYVILSTPGDELLRIYYQLKILEENSYYYVVDLRELDREELTPSHRDNPLNYPVFATLYRHHCKEEIARWLEEQPGLFLSGELNDGEAYKWLNGGLEPWEEFDCTQAISAEFYLTKEELLIFSQQPEKLAGITRLLTEDLRGTLLLQGQYYLKISEIYARMFIEDNCNSPAKLANLLQEQQADSMLLHVEPRQKGRFMAYIGKMAAKSVKLGPGASYHVLQDSQFLAELYAAGNWLKICVYRGDGTGMLARFKAGFHLVEVIKDRELDNHYDLFTPPLSDQRRWMIFRRLHQLGTEAGFIKRMRLVASVRVRRHARGRTPSGSDRRPPTFRVLLSSAIVRAFSLKSATAQT